MCILRIDFNIKNVNALNFLKTMIYGLLIERWFFQPSLDKVKQKYDKIQYTVMKKNLENNVPNHQGN